MSFDCIGQPTFTSTTHDHSNATKVSRIINRSLEQSFKSNNQSNDQISFHAVHRIINQGNSHLQNTKIQRMINPCLFRSLSSLSLILVCFETYAVYHHINHNLSLLLNYRQAIRSAKQLRHWAVQSLCIMFLIINHGWSANSINQSLARTRVRSTSFMHSPCFSQAPFTYPKRFIREQAHSDVLRSGDRTVDEFLSAIWGCRFRVPSHTPFINQSESDLIAIMPFTRYVDQSIK